jgi:hypothetical protein
MAAAKSIGVSGEPRFELGDYRFEFVDALLLRADHVKQREHKRPHRRSHLIFECGWDGQSGAI